MRNRERVRRWRKNNPKKARECDHKSYMARREKKLEYQKRYVRENRERLNEYHREYYRRKKEAGNDTGTKSN